METNSRLLREARGEAALLLLSVAGGAVGGVLVVAQAWLLSGIVARVFLQGHSFSQVRAAMIVLLGVMVARALVALGSELAATRAAIRLKVRLRQRLFEQLMALGPLFTRGERAGELANTATEGLEALEAWFSQYLPQVAIAAVVPLTVLAAVFPVDALSGAVLFFTVPVIPLFMVLIGRATETLTRRQWHRLSRMSAHFLDVLQGLTTLKLLGSTYARESIAQVSEDFRRVTMRLLSVAFLSA
ncbi:MAG: ABC transporter transmembrane domain-containing protein, partial [Armatimonadota bacterium]|nr:ABC transporter transmembrane domain-containing protein [Armatimonadota bacterium]